MRLTARDQESEVAITDTIPLGVRVASTPLSEELLAIETSPFVPSFVEGVQGTFTISGRLLGGASGVKEITVLNLPEGASQKAVADGIEVTWTPPYSTIAGENQFSTTLPLEVRLTARDQESEVSITNTVPLGIYISRPPLTTHSMAIEVSPQMPRFVEGVEGTFTLSGKLLGGAMGSHEITILNLPEGASQKAVADGIEVTWTPPYSTITGTQLFTSYPLEVQLTTRDQDQEVEATITDIIPLGVRVASPPLSKKLLAIETNPTIPSFVEGVEQSFVISGTLLGGANGSKEITVLNLPEGASQKAMEGGIQVTWTPPYSTITGEKQFSTTYPLQVQFTARDQGAEVTITDTIPLGVRVGQPSLSEKLMSIRVNPEVPHFIEGMQGTFTLSGELLAGVTAAQEITILNLPEGASQKMVEDGIEVTWTPSDSTITGAKNFSTTYPLEVQLVASNEEGEFTITETISLGIRVAYPPLDSELLFIDIEPKVVNLEEGTPGTFTILGKVFGQSDALSELTVLNLPSGATQKPVEGGIEVTWTPSAHTVPNDQYLIEYPLQVQLAASMGEETASKNVTIPIWVHTDIEQAPIIENVTFPKHPIPENEKGSMVITVLDQSNGAPTLHFLPVAKGSKNGIYYVVYDELQPVQDPEVPNRWTYTVGINFAERNITSEAFADVEVGVKAYSRYGVSSTVYPFSYRVLNRVTAPITGWVNDMRIPYGKELRLSFSISDPRNEGIITTNFEQACKTYLVKNYKCKCKKRSGGENKKCEMEWFAFKQAPREINFIYTAKNTNAHDSTDFKEATFQSDILLYRE